MNQLLPDSDSHQQFNNCDNWSYFAAGVTEDVDNKSKEVVVEVKTPVKSVGEVETEREQETEQEDSGEEKRKCRSCFMSHVSPTQDNNN